jgi:hypothetical protein
MADNFQIVIGECIVWMMHHSPIKYFHMSGELKPLGTNKTRILGSTIIGPRVIHKNHVINSYSHMIDLYNLAQGSYLWIQREFII